jgi:AcrR family transcriptional regulator
MMQPAEGRKRTFTELARRAQIVDAAIDTIAELGYSNASFGRIAERAGLSSTGMISYYFDGKNELDGEVIAAALRQAGEYIEPRIEAAPTHRDMLRAYIETNLEFVAAYPTLTRALAEVVTGSRYRAPGVGHFLDAFEQLAEQLRAGQAAGEFRQFDARVMAVAIRGAIDATVGQFGRDPSIDIGVDARELAESFDRCTRASA